MDIACELCLDLVLIAETYAECGEVRRLKTSSILQGRYQLDTRPVIFQLQCDQKFQAEVEGALEKKCDKDYSSPATDKLCRSMVEKIAHVSAQSLYIVGVRCATLAYLNFNFLSSNQE